MAKFARHYTEFNLMYKNLKTNQNPKKIITKILCGHFFQNDKYNLAYFSFYILHLVVDHPVELQNVCPRWDSNLQSLGEHRLNLFTSSISIIWIIWSKLKFAKPKYLIVRTF